MQVGAYQRGNHCSLYHDFRFACTFIFFFKRNTNTRSFSDILIEYPRQTKRYFTFAFISKLRLVRCLTVAEHYFTRISSSRIFRRARLKIRQIKMACFPLNSNYRGKRTGLAIDDRIANAKTISIWTAIFTVHRRFQHVCVCAYTSLYISMHARLMYVCSWISASLR